MKPGHWQPTPQSDFVAVSDGKTGQRA